jgi:hypothetical protein
MPPSSMDGIVQCRRMAPLRPQLCLFYFLNFNVVGLRGNIFIVYISRALELDA